MILKHLKQNSQIIIVDEVDYLVGSKNVIEILRDIQDNTGVPIIFVGMGAMDKKIARFEHFSPNDIKEILEQITEIKFTEDAILYRSTRTNQFRQLVKLLEKIEKLSQRNGIDEFDEYTLKGILNEIQNLKTLPKIEKMYA